MNRLLARLLALVLVPVALLTAGCFQIENRIVVNEDGSGSQTLRFALPADIVASLGMGTELPTVEDLEGEADMQSLREALGDHGEVRVFSSQEEGVGFEMTITVDASDDFAAAIEARAAEIEAAMPAEMLEGELSPLDMAATDSFELHREGDEWIFEYAAAPMDPAMLGDLTGDPDMGGMAAMMMGQMTVETTILLPGEVTEHNADEVLEDGTLVWRQAGTDGARTYSARSDVGTGLSTMMRAGLLIGGIGLVAAVGGYLLFGRKRQSV